MGSKLGFHRFLLLWTGEFVSSIGGGLTSFGLGVYVFGKTGSAASMALVTLLAFLPTLLLSVPAGVLADRYDRRLLMMPGDGCSATGILFILFCMLNGGASLTQICIGVTISSVFSSLLEPSYRATVTDLLDAEEYSRASGMVSLAGSARYLISPVLAGALLTVSDIRLLLILDICTFFLTVVCTGVVRKGLAAKAAEEKEPFFEALKMGWRAVTKKRGVFLLILLSSVMTCFMGAFQILAEPLILDFADSATLGIGETVCAGGMLVSGLVLGARGIKKGYLKVLSASLAAAGGAMVLFGLKENIYLICAAGFLFFAMLPFANNCLDYLVRTNIADELQGRAWGFIGFLSQIGYVVAYGFAGVSVDGIGERFQVGVGRGAAAVTTWLFMAVSAFMFALTCILFVSLLTSANTLMEKAQTPDFLQMHAGEVSEEELARFAEGYDQVRDYQTLNFLNLENGSITLNGHSLADSTQDNGVCVQSGSFDFLLNLENEIIRVSDGEIYIPVCYRQEYDLAAGETVQIGENSFIIAGFLRDSQMNSMMASSKRFLVSSSDYERLRAVGSEEYLIEFLLQEGADINAFATQYTDAGLSGNGPTITKPLIRMMNALSDGLMILVILLVSVVLLLISMLCIRFTLLTQLEADRKEIGMLKAIGISGGDIRKLYNLKFLALSGLGAVTGLFPALLANGTISAQIQELYGASENGLPGLLAAFFGVVLTEGVLLLSVARTLKHTEKLSAVEALTGRHGERESEKRQLLSPQYLIVALVIALGIFMMILPQNLLSTISSPRFVTYMGIGDGEIRLDIRQTEDIAGKTEQVEKLLAGDEWAADFVTLRTTLCRIVLPDGSHSSLQIEQGDHTVFPVTYAEGESPKEKNEIALSYLCADEMGLSLGDEIRLSIDENEQEYTVCGIYSDITNGGKTAKAAELHRDGPLMWSVFYVSLKSGVGKEQWLSEYAEILSDSGISAKAVDIQEYVADTYGQTIREIRMAARLAVVAAALVMFVVVVLFTRLLVANDRYDISLRKALGLTGRDIKERYLLGYLPVLLAGILAGVLSGNLLGERLAGLLLKMLGATGFRFTIDYKTACICIPVMAVTTVICAVLPGLSEIKNIRAYECCTGKE